MSEKWVVMCKVDAPEFTEWKPIKTRGRFPTKAGAMRRMRERIITGRGPVFRSNFIYKVVKEENHE
jgi:hypothetical protein